METVALILHVLAASVLVGGQVLLFLAVTPATWLIDDERLRSAVTRVVARRFALLTVGALVVLLVTGLYQFSTVTGEVVRSNMMDFNWGPVFITKMVGVAILTALVVFHGAYLGPRIGRLADAAADGGDEETAWRLENLRRHSLLLSLGMMLLSVVVLAFGVMLGYHPYSYRPF